MMRSYFERKYEQALDVLRRSTACSEIEALIRADAIGGRPRALSVEHLLAATITAIDPQFGPVTHVAIHRLLTQMFRPAFHQRHAIPRNLTLRQVRYTFNMIVKALDYSPHSKKNADTIAAERILIEDRTYRFLNQFIQDSIPQALPRAASLTLDATAIDTWARPASSPPLKEKGEDYRNDDSTWATQNTGSFDPDGRVGYRTQTYANGGSMFFGYTALTTATIYDKDSPFEKLNLVNANLLIPNGSYQPDATMRLFDDHLLADNPNPIILVDRGFSDRDRQHWAQQLLARGITQYFDMKSTDLKPKVDPETGVLMAAGWPFAPWTPQELFDITPPARYTVRDTPRPKATDKQKLAHIKDQAAKEKFRAQIAALAPYALVPNGRAKADGTWRFFTDFAPRPPADWKYPPDDEPKLHRIYNQPTITIKSEAFGKYQQPHRWGTDEWIEIYARRTAIEGIFGNLKQSTGENITRGRFRVRGIAANALVTTLAMVHYNLRMINNWALEHNVDADDVYAATNEAELLALLQAEADPAEANAPPAA